MGKTEFLSILLHVECTNPVVLRVPLNSEKWGRLTLLIWHFLSSHTPFHHINRATCTFIFNHKHTLLTAYASHCAIQVEMQMRFNLALSHTHGLVCVCDIMPGLYQDETGGKHVYSCMCVGMYTHWAIQLCNFDHGRNSFHQFPRYF